MVSIKKEAEMPYEKEETTPTNTTKPITQSAIEKNKTKYAKIVKNTVSQSVYENLKNKIRDIAKKINCPK